MSVSLRDFFAAHAAAALVNRADSPASIARRAFDVADALLAERQYREELEWLATPPDSMRAARAETSMVRPSDAPAGEKLPEPHLLDDPAPLEEESEPLEPSTPSEDPEEAELAALAAREEEERAEILAMIQTEGYVPAWDPSWDDRADMTYWDRDARWERASSAASSKPKSDRPGLARTVPGEQMELRLGDTDENRRTGSG
ncbi:MAG: hypothetical protein U0414_36425 [Polyangiaceae bacterium]